MEWCIPAHKDAIEKACILHRDISLFNLLLDTWNRSDDRMQFLNVLPEQTRKRLYQQIKASVSHRGLLVDWGYAVPIEPASSEPVTRPSTPDSRSDSVEPEDCDEGAVPTVLRNDQPTRSTVVYVPVSKLGQNHEIKLPLAGEAVDPARPSIDTNPLYRTVSLQPFVR